MRLLDPLDPSKIGGDKTPLSSFLGILPATSRDTNVSTYVSHKKTYAKHHTYCFSKNFIYHCQVCCYQFFEIPGPLPPPRRDGRNIFLHPDEEGAVAQEFVYILHNLVALKIK